MRRSCNGNTNNSSTSSASSGVGSSTTSTDRGTRKRKTVGGDRIAQLSAIVVKGNPKVDRACDAVATATPTTAAPVVLAVASVRQRPQLIEVLGSARQLAAIE